VTLSVVLPTFNCRKLIERHLRSMQSWAGLADEIVVVDSRSTDGTIELIKTGLQHPRLRIIERDRGLYESWNDGIAATSGRWIYISTVGDTIERAHLLHLIETGEAEAADVVISNPRFVNDDGMPLADPGWPAKKIIELAGLPRPFTLTPLGAGVLASLYSPKALLGSSASNVYRGEFLRRHPFPTEFAAAGDSAWILRHATEARLRFTPAIGTTFCMHEKPVLPRHARKTGVLRMLLREKQALILRLAKEPVLARELTEENDLLLKAREHHSSRRRVWKHSRNRPTWPIHWLWLTGLYHWYRVRRQRKRQYIQRVGKRSNLLFQYALGETNDDKAGNISAALR
jgi:glycosyltransferase involved in cell wall biosynthesis